jgi:purine-binding chemotaxis protein CheW
VKPAHLVCFRIGRETFGVDIFSVREIVRVREITKVPGAPGFVLGVINLRGRIISVVDLGRHLGLAPSEIGPASRILVVQLDEATVGFLVDAATAVLKVPGDAIEPPPELMGDVHSDSIQGVAKLEGRLAILLNLQRVLTRGQEAAAAAHGSTTNEPIGAAEAR